MQLSDLLRRLSLELTWYNRLFYSFSFYCSFFDVSTLSCVHLLPTHIYYHIFIKKASFFYKIFLFFYKKKQKLRPAFNLLTLLFFLLNCFENVPHAVLQFFLLLHSLPVLFAHLLTLAISCLSLFLVPKLILQRFQKKL